MADTEIFDLPAVGTDCTDCPVPDCAWFGTATALVEHLKTVHGAMTCRR